MGLRQYIDDYNKNALPEIELQKKLLREQMANQAQQERDVMSRQFARFGGGPAGASIKAQSNLEENIGQRQQQGEMGLMAADIATKRQLQEAEKGREFVTKERLSSQEFSSGEAEKARKIDYEFRNKVFNAEDAARIKQMDIQQQQFAKQMDLEERAFQVNKWLAEHEAGKPTDLMGSLFGPAFSTSGGQLRNTLGGAGIGAGIGAGVGGAFGGAPGAITGAKVGGTIGAVVGGSCFAYGTKILMADGTEKEIQKIEIGDICEEGGEVYKLHKSITMDIFDYQDVYVTGSHAVYECGEWIRVEDSSIAINMNIEEPREIFCVANKNHIIKIKDIIFSDFDEIDNGDDLTEDESILALNKKRRI